MSYILLKIETGTWSGGNDGQYPKLIEWELGNIKYPIHQSDGWGHGFGGGSFSLREFYKEIGFAKLNSESSNWAYKIISHGLVNNHSIEHVGAQLYNESKNNKVELPEKLQIILNSRIRWVNV